MDVTTINGTQDLVQFLEDVLQSTMMKLNQEGLRDQIRQGAKPVSDYNTAASFNNHQSINRKLLQVLANTNQLEQKLDHCLWTQNVFVVLMSCLTVLLTFCLYILYSKWNTATF